MKNYIRVSMQDLQSAGHTVKVCGVIVRWQAVYLYLT